MPHVVLAVHGGTGQPQSELTPELEREYRAGLEAALRAGYEVLQREQSTSLDAVEEAIRTLEDNPLFNAGKGAVFTHEGRNELDASIMEGQHLRGGAVAGVCIVRNPISAARAVLEKSRHVMLIGRGAEVFATEAGLEIVDPQYFWTERRWQEWKRARDAEAIRQSHVERPTAEWGTVGAVALDRSGNLAAGTSTGGMTNKRFGRVGDSPILGAGTYADNNGCAVSCTGHGEYFIRYAVAHDIDCLVKYKGLPVRQAVDDVIQKLKSAGGEGGAIVLDAQGRYASSYHADGLYRGTITNTGTVTVRLYSE
jgi:beta-aspartyl-peptidase (threonine type)